MVCPFVMCRLNLKFLWRFHQSCGDLEPAVVSGLYDKSVLFLKAHIITATVVNCSALLAQHFPCADASPSLLASEAKEGTGVTES